MKIFLLCVFITKAAALYPQTIKGFSYSYGAVVRGDSAKKELALVFTADEFGEGLPSILQTLNKEKVKASFFFTGRFYRNPAFAPNIVLAKTKGHYLGPHSDEHLLYCDWNKRDSLLVTQLQFKKDLLQNQSAMLPFQLSVDTPLLFIPPYEWWNDSIAAWSRTQGLLLFNFSPGMRTNADYTWPGLSAYKSNEWLMNWVRQTITSKPDAFNGAIVLIHAGTDPRRKEKFYSCLREMIRLLKANGYAFKRIDKLLLR